ncbi:eukaryotic translation initiation factor 4E transporter isoform X3 [Stegostoma tigrinum]|uniref:eukaryotic translation initiation factor 4E transporter isoform X3 n=1 Tax=Stegostoma tigrinum TaxID=3053191 RepID=UPI0028705DD4|nr:eukaryotic translation initiation factor 4E transporter isoform X3 [Stegostoma tigrinum]
MFTKPSVAAMDKKEWIEENGEPLVNLPKICVMKKPYRYSKEKLLEIKDYPYAKRRPACLLEKYDSEGIWDPEKWHASLYPSSGRSSPTDGTKKDYSSDLDRAVLKRRMADPRERIKEEDIDVVLSPQRRSFGGGCHVISTSNSRRSGSPLENKENENSRGLGAQRRIGSGRIIASRTFDRDGRDKDLRDRDVREGRDYKEKRFRREYGDGKRVFGERRRCDSYTEEEPEWFSAGPTSQSETIELTGFDDKVLMEDPRRPKRWRKRSDILKEGAECNGGGQETDTSSTVPATEADQEVPQEAVLPEQTPGDFDFNEFFNMEKSVPGLALMIEEVLGEGSVSSSRFSQWFSSNVSRPGSRSSSLRSTPHEELERLAGLEQRIPTPVSQLAQTGVVLSVEEVEAGLKGLKVEPERKLATPFMVEHLEQTLTSSSGSKPAQRDMDMTAFNKLVNTMKASGTLPSQPKPPEILPPHVMGPPSPDILGDLLGNQNHSTSTLLNQRGHSSPIPTFQQSSPSEFFRVKSPLGYAPNAPHIRDHFQGLPLPKNISPIPAPQAVSPSQLDMRQGAMDGLPFAQDLHMPGGDVYQPGYGKMHHDHRDGYRVRQQRISRSPGPASQHRLNAASPSQSSSFTNMLSPSFTPTSVIRKMFESKDKSKDGKENRPVKDCVEDGPLIEDHLSSGSPMENTDRGASPIGGTRSTYHRSACTTPQLNQMRFTKDQDYRPRSTGRKTPTRASPVPGSPFQRPICPVPIMSHVPLVRQSPPHLPPGLVQRMLAQGVSPQQLHPALLHAAGMFPSGMDLSHLQSLPPTLLGQTFYPLPTSGLPLLNPRATLSSTHIQASATPLQHLAMIRQVLQSPSAGGQGPGAHLHLNQQNSNLRSLHHRSGSPVNLSKWFGNDVLQQPLPSMPSKVISVDELELHQ